MVLKMKELITSNLTMTSLEIAELCEKRHGDVLRDIDNLISSLNEELRLGFISTSYKDATGKSNRMFNLDKNSTLCLVSGYNPDLRMKIIKYIDILENQKSSKPLTTIDLLLATVTKLAEQEKVQWLLEQKTNKLEQNLSQTTLDLDNLKTQFDITETHVSIAGWLNLKNIKLSTKEMATMGKRASVECSKRNLSRLKLDDQRFGKVHSYPKKLLDEIFIL